MSQDAPRCPRCNLPMHAQVTNKLLNAFTWVSKPTGAWVCAGCEVRVEMERNEKP